MVGGLLLEVTWFKPVQDCQVTKSKKLFCNRGKPEIGQQNHNSYRGNLFSYKEGTTWHIKEPSEYCARPVFEWSKHVQLLKGLKT